MAEPVKNPFDLLLEQFREIIREEIKAASNGNGRAVLLTAEELAEALQVNKATVYEWVNLEQYLTIRPAGLFDSICAKF